MLTQERLKELLHYEPETGVFTWLTYRMQAARTGYVAGCITSRGYRHININGKKYKAHRLAFLYMTGSLPPKHVDHINGVLDDNRWKNIRSVTHSDNMRNKKLSKNSRSGFIGISRHSSSESWRVQISDNGKRIHRDFADSKFGGRYLALMASAFYSVKLRKENGYHENHGRN